MIPNPYLRDMPAAQGLYDPANEHDACGVAFVADLAGRAHHEVLRQGLTALRNLDHRGASGHDPQTGDGAGVLTQIPDALLRTSVDVMLPPAGAYAAGICFLPQDAGARDIAVRAISAIVRDEGLRLVVWRDVPVASEVVGRAARQVEPVMRMLIVAKEDSDGAPLVGIALDRHAYPVRKRIEHEVGVYLASLSSRTITYKGMLTTHQLGAYFLDLDDPRYATAIALVHSRFSTNTFPSWPLAHPYRFIAHNGEINTIRGNRNWMRARESLLGNGTVDGAPAIPGDIHPAVPRQRRRQQRLGQLRRGPGAAAPRWPVAPARGPDDGSRGVGEQPAHGARPARVLRVPRERARGVGRPGERLLHRRHPDRRGPGPQRPAPGSLGAHRGRPRRPRVGGRRPGPRPEHDRRARPPGPREDVPGRHRTGPGSCRTTRSRTRSPPSSPTATGWRPGRSTCGTCRPASSSCPTTPR